MAAKKKRKTGVIILLTILLAIMIGLGILAFLQWNNIRALWFSAHYTMEEQQKMLTDDQQKTQEILDELGLGYIKPLNPEQEELLQIGEISEEEALQIITQKEVPEATTSAEEKQTGTTGNLEQLIGKVYLLRTTFVGKLTGLETQAKQEYTASGGNVDLVSFAQKFLQQGALLEKECDEEMKTLLSAIEGELKAQGKDLGLVSQIRTSYETEKSVKKAALFEKYQ